MFSIECILLSHHQEVEKPKLTIAVGDRVDLVDWTGCEWRRNSRDDFKLLVLSKVREGAAIR